MPDSANRVDVRISCADVLDCVGHAGAVVQVAHGDVVRLSGVIAGHEALPGLTPVHVRHEAMEVTRRRLHAFALAIAGTHIRALRPAPVAFGLGLSVDDLLLEGADPAREFAAHLRDGGSRPGVARAEADISRDLPRALAQGSLSALVSEGRSHELVREAAETFVERSAEAPACHLAAGYLVLGPAQPDGTPFDLGVAVRGAPEITATTSGEIERARREVQTAPSSPSGESGEVVNLAFARKRRKRK